MFNFHRGSAAKASGEISFDRRPVARTGGGNRIGYHCRPTIFTVGSKSTYFKTGGEIFSPLIFIKPMVKMAVVKILSVVATYIWGSPFFTSSNAYTQLIGQRMVHPAFHWLWKSACQNKTTQYERHSLPAWHGIAFI